MTRRECGKGTEYGINKVLRTLGDRLWHLLVLIRNGEKTLFEVMTRISQLDNIHATLPSPMVYKDPLSLEEFDNL